MGSSRRSWRPLLARQRRGDWGSAGKADAIQLTDAEGKVGSLGTSEDGKRNASALQTGDGRILSSRRTAQEERIWCRTGRIGVTATGIEVLGLREKALSLGEPSFAWPV